MLEAKSIFRVLKTEQIHTLYYINRFFPNGVNVDRDLLGFYSNIRSIILILVRRGLIKEKLGIDDTRGKPLALKEYVLTELGKKVLIWFNRMSMTPQNKL